MWWQQCKTKIFMCAHHIVDRELVRARSSSRVFVLSPRSYGGCGLGLLVLILIICGQAGAFSGHDDNGALSPPPPSP